MIDDKRFICIIPARGGSQGLPGKNIMPIGGAPMIAHAIAKGLASGALDRVLVSTDDPAIARVAREHGAEVPFLRDAALARSDTPMVPVIIDVLERLAACGEHYDYALMLQANSPLLLGEQIDEVARKIVREDLDVVFTVAEVPHPPQWTIRLGEDGPSFAFMDLTQEAGERRQEQEQLYRSTGAIFAVRTKYLMRNSATARLCLPVAGQRSGVVVTDPRSAVDIDTELDFLLAETIFQRQARPSL